MRLFPVVLARVQQISTLRFQTSKQLLDDSPAFLLHDMTLRGERKIKTEDCICTVLDVFLRTPKCSLTHIWCTCVCWKSELEKPPESLAHQSCLSLKQQPASPLTSLRHSPCDQSDPGSGIFRKWGRMEAGRKPFGFFLLLSSSAL